MNRMIALCLAVVGAAYCGFATDYYVDAVNGNDANSGLEGSPKESFVALFAAYTIRSGDKVRANRRSRPMVHSTGTWML